MKKVKGNTRRMGYLDVNEGLGNSGGGEQRFERTWEAFAGGISGGNGKGLNKVFEESNGVLFARFNGMIESSSARSETSAQRDSGFPDIGKQKARSLESNIAS
jgi:hypothetical protein